MIYEIILAGVSFFHPQPQDSIGVETVNGKIFVIHKVDEKETLYAISRRYGATIEAIMQSNPGMSATLEIGQIVKVPYTPKGSSTVSSSAQTHRVEAKETMYSISKMYGVSVDEIKQWNNLTDNALSIGQELIVKKPGVTTTTRPAPVTSPTPANGKKHTVAQQETLYGVARQYGITVQQLKTWNALESDELKVGQELFVSTPDSRTAVATTQEVVPTPRKEETVQPIEKPKEQPVETATPKAEQPVASSQPKTQPQTIRISESVKNTDEILESGLAELIEGTEGNRKYLALHRTAPVGTILKVRNEMNSREVFVRVMGKLPDTAVNNKLVIKLSRSAYDRLGAIDPKFRVEITYYK